MDFTSPLYMIPDCGELTEDKRKGKIATKHS